MLVPVIPRPLRATHCADPSRHHVEDLDELVQLNFHGLLGVGDSDKGSYVGMPGLAAFLVGIGRFRVPPLPIPYNVICHEVGHEVAGANCAIDSCNDLPRRVWKVAIDRSHNVGHRQIAMAL